jgi:predicted ferric reductase
MEQHPAKIRSIQHITHDVLQAVTPKPRNNNFAGGKPTDFVINKNDLTNEKRPFTFTCLHINNFLQFAIKTYPSLRDVNNELLKNQRNVELILHEVFGEISHKGEGVSIAGGGGITPFISFFRYLQSKSEVIDNKLFYVNKTKDDIILAFEFRNLSGDNFVNVLSDEKENEYAYGKITESFLNDNIVCIDRQIFVSGPPPVSE